MDFVTKSENTGCTCDCYAKSISLCLKIEKSPT